jgi:hypothetical protein
MTADTSPTQQHVSNAWAVLIFVFACLLPILYHFALNDCVLEWFAVTVPTPKTCGTGRMFISVALPVVWFLVAVGWCFHKLWLFERRQKFGESSPLLPESKHEIPSYQ